MTTPVPDRAAIFAAAELTKEQRRELVLKYPDIAEKLRQPPYKGTPHGWSGFIPSATYETGTGLALNPSPVRIQLLAIVMEAAERADANPTDLWT